MSNETEDYLRWKEGFDWSDDGLLAYRSIVALEAIRFELVMKGEGYLDRIKEISEAEGRNS